MPAPQGGLVAAAKASDRAKWASTGTAAVRRVALVKHGA
eukprot:COSAG01_NODE_72226_length_253_cov_1.318182_1_plen_38_part_10